MWQLEHCRLEEALARRDIARDRVVRRWRLQHPHIGDDGVDLGIGHGKRGHTRLRNSFQDQIAQRLLGSGARPAHIEDAGTMPTACSVRSVAPHATRLKCFLAGVERFAPRTTARENPGDAVLIAIISASACS